MSSGSIKEREAIFAGGRSVFTVMSAATLPPIRSGKSAIAFALNGVTRCRSSICLKSFVTATATLMPSAEKSETAV